MTRRSKKLLTRALTAKALLMLAGMFLTPQAVEEPAEPPQPPPPKPVPISNSNPKPYCQLGSEKESIWSVAWSPDGCWVAAGTAEGAVRIWTPSGRQAAAFHPTRNAMIVAWRPDSRALAVAGGGVIRFYTGPGWKEPDPRLRIAASPACLAWGPGGKWLAEDTGPNGIRLWNTRTGRLVRRVSFRSFAAIPEPGDGCIMDASRPALAWRPGSRQLAYVGPDDRFRVWDATTGKLRLRRRAADWETSGVDWSPDGKRLVVGNMDGEVSTWDGSTGVRRRLLRGESGGCTVKSVAWCPTGPWVAIGGDEYPHGTPIRIYDVRTGKRWKSLWGHRGEVHTLSWSPHGKTLASGSRDSGVRLWEVAKSPWP